MLRLNRTLSHTPPRLIAQFVTEGSYQIHTIESIMSILWLERIFVGF